MAVRDAPRPLTSVVTQVASDLAYLVQTEFRLARAEIGEKLSSMANGGVFIGVAFVLLLSGLVILLMTIAEWLIFAGLASRWSYLLVGGVVVVGGLVFALLGAKRFKASELVPNRTIRDLTADIQVTKEHVR